GLLSDGADVAVSDAGLPVDGEDAADRGRRMPASVRAGAGRGPDARSLAAGIDCARPLRPAGDAMAGGLQPYAGLSESRQSRVAESDAGRRRSVVSYRRAVRQALVGLAALLQHIGCAALAARQAVAGSGLRRGLLRAAPVRSDAGRRRGLSGSR